ncbi:aldehyde dehydrogenase family protein [Variovorax paradoxus]|uniref:aldehyde dehydrogenase family protein n=1 Tax=Variovorax paradoxus TaxID=34073 RepID=UPI003AAE2C65
MREFLKFYIDGQWVSPSQSRTIDLTDPSTEEISGRLALAGIQDVDLAVAAARGARADYAKLDRAARIELLSKVVERYEARSEELAIAVSTEMGAPLSLSRRAQVPSGADNLRTAIAVLKDFSFEEQRGSTLIAREPIGVAALITPWNWPLNQITAMLAPALAVGCTVVWKPSEYAAFSAQILAEILHEAGVPAGVFNMIHGDGPTAGAALCAHPGVDAVSFTGSTRAGIEVARNAAPTVKRVHQELGGKSPNIVLDDADFSTAVKTGVLASMRNSGQTCTAPTRMLVPHHRMSEAIEIARDAVAGIDAGPAQSDSFLGPVVSRMQWEKIQSLIDAGIQEGATLVAGGPDRPPHLTHGFYVRPTVFANVRNDMRIAQEEIFGPVLCVLGYGDDDEAVAIANDTPYGLAAYVQGGDLPRARRIASRLHAGQVRLNGAGEDMLAPFGGYKQSGNGREGGAFGFESYLEIKAVLGFDPKPAS